MMRKTGISRRDVLAAGAATTASLILPKSVFAQGSSQIKLGVIGCGGRGSGAVHNNLDSNPDTVLWAMGDLFPDRLNGSRASITEAFKSTKRVQVTDDRAFSGFDAYQRVLASGVDMVILATPPGFRPIHFKAAIEAGKHVFTEKPVATDSPGIRAFIEAANLAKTKGLNVAAGTQRRHDLAYSECMKRIHDGQLGDIVACYAYWNQGGLWDVAKKLDMSETEWQLRNWLYFTWISGDHIVEQHIHNIDVCIWAKGEHPVKATCLAGRQVRTDPRYGHIFDHFATEYEFADRTKLISMCRQIDNTASRVSERIVGTKGSSDANRRIEGESPWRWEGETPDPYMLEHRDLYNSITGKAPYINEGVQVAESTMTAIMGRMAGYTGAEITWDKAIASEENIFPEHLAFGPMDIPPVAMPGKTAFK